MHLSVNLESIEGLPPRLDADPLPGCRFAPRCAHVREECTRGEPALEAGPDGRERRCIIAPESLR